MSSLITIQITQPYPLKITMKYTGKNSNFFGAEEQEYLVVIPSQEHHPEHMERKFYTHQFPLLGNGEFKVSMTDGFMIMHKPKYQKRNISAFECIEDVLQEWLRKSLIM
jgi:hypothetical protein